MTSEASIDGGTDELTGDAIERFYHLAVAAEREACAKLCEATPYLRTTLGGRSRAEVEGGLLAEAIRARSQS